jgi:hypothetical protein
LITIAYAGTPKTHASRPIIVDNGKIACLNVTWLYDHFALRIEAIAFRHPDFTHFDLLACNLAQDKDPVTDMKSPLDATIKQDQFVHTMENAARGGKTSNALAYYLLSPTSYRLLKRLF